jgi:O-acetyl-ADP-ribose deacetylase (regulator of RNase III)
MIEFIQGDILKSDAEALVNTVNCVGVMGRGVALQFKNAYPLNYKQYKIACAHGEVQPGQMLVFETGTLTNPKYIINFPTKRHWKGKSRIEDIDSGLEALRHEIQLRKITSIAVPPLGSGLGGLSWPNVRSHIESYLADMPDVQIMIHEPRDTPAITSSSEVPAMTPGRAAMIILMNKYLAALMDPFVTLLEIHKLMYFMQESGEGLRLKYVKGLYGPYSENLRHVLKAMEGHFISGYGDGGDSPDKQFELVPGATKDADVFLADNADTQAHLNKVFDLVSGFETPFGLELLSTVHWVAKHNQISNDDELVKYVYAWGPRKRKFSERQIVIASKTLHANNWL